jgi:death-on-curing protein
VTYRWVAKSTVLAIHDEQLAEHGGLPGIRDENGIDAALARPLHLLAHEKPDLFDLAAAYACGFAQRQYFNDGNKRVSAVVTELFLELNGKTLTVDDAEFVRVWQAIASKLMTEAEFAAWLRDNSSDLTEAG